VRRYSLFAGTVIMALSLSVVMRVQACDVFDDKTDKYALGQYLLDSIHLELRATEQVQKCIREGQSCTYRDERGVDYELINTDENISAVMELSSPQINVIEVNEDYRGHLIADIKMGDSLETVRKKLKSLPAKFPPWEYEEPLGALRTECNIRSSNGAEWSYNLYFRNDKLNWVDAGAMDPVSTE
jgi:hypothetical protein